MSESNGHLQLKGNQSKADELADMSALELIERDRDRTLSPVEVARYTLERTSESQYSQKVNAFCLIDEETALAMAKASEDRWAKGEPRTARWSTNCWPTVQ